MKLELIVKKISNEDVIATSGQVCNLHSDAAHIYTYSDVYDDPWSGQCINVDQYLVGDVTSSSQSSPLVSVYFDATPTNGQWYYWDSVSGKYKICTGNHDGYTKVTH